MISKTKKKRGITRFPGITVDAVKLGVHRVTLFRALNDMPGWHLPKLVDRYKRLKQEDKTDAETQKETAE